MWHEKHGAGHAGSAKCRIFRLGLRRCFPCALRWRFGSSRVSQIPEHLSATDRGCRMLRRWNVGTTTSRVHKLFLINALIVIHFWFVGHSETDTFL